MRQEYTVNNNLTRHLNPPYLVSNMDELNLLANLMENRLGITYTTKIIHFHHHQNGSDAVYKSTVNKAFKRNQPRIKPPRKSQNLQGKIVSGKRQECAKQIKCRL